MDVRLHLSQHEATEQLPLVTESATVSDVTTLDRSRNDAVLRAIRETLDDRASVAWQHRRPESDAATRRFIRDQLDAAEWGTPLNQYLTERAKQGETAGRLAALQERYLRAYPSLLSVTVETDEPVDFVAGQYLCIRYDGITRPYSVASSPNRDELEFCIRRVPGGRLTSELADTLSPGDEVTLRGPYGEFVMHPPSERDLVFLATGTGVAPFRSMIDYCFEQGRDSHDGRTRDIWLFLGCAWEDDLPYRERFRELAREHDHFHFVPSLTRERYLTDWDGERDYVQHILVKYVTDDALAGIDLPREFERFRDDPRHVDAPASLRPDDMEVYACGINAMVYGLVDAVERLGVPERHIDFEGFG